MQNAEAADQGHAGNGCGLAAFTRKIPIAAAPGGGPIRRAVSPPRSKSVGSSGCRTCSNMRLRWGCRTRRVGSAANNSSSAKKPTSRRRGGGYEVEGVDWVDADTRRSGKHRQRPRGPFAPLQVPPPAQPAYRAAKGIPGPLRAPGRFLAPHNKPLISVPNRAVLRLRGAVEAALANSRGNSRLLKRKA
jgi:hypothetical protein